MRVKKPTRKVYKSSQDSRARPVPAFALCWAAICLNLYGRDNSDLSKQIDKRFAATAFLGETKNLALAVIALGAKTNPFRI